ncbi:MAG TPA: hypothetical protein VHU18_08740 [Rhizomicrobium sp.]|nr:hypothetical protein [Rhizomicrobium sp.]
MLDAGQASRAVGEKTFADITDLTIAASRVAEQAEKFFRWAAVSGALLLEYHTVAFDADATIDRIEASLGLRTDREQAKRHAFEEAFTQKNKAQRNRFLSELTEQQNEEMKELFSTFISNFIDGEPTQFLSEKRLEILEREASRRSPGAGGARHAISQ